MGILDRLLGRAAPDRTEWGEIVNNITLGLMQVREDWFETCVETLEDASTDERTIVIQRLTLDGDGLRAANAYQLFLVSSFLAGHRYIPPSQGRDFADLLFAQVCGSDLTDTMEFFVRYQRAPDRGNGLFRFASDIAEHITGNKTPLMEGMAVGASTPLRMRVPSRRSGSLTT
jgi:hypothetical protein